MPPDSGLTVQIFEVATNREVCRTSSHTGPLRCVAFNATVDLLVCGDMLRGMVLLMRMTCLCIFVHLAPFLSPSHALGHSGYDRTDQDIHV
jgi:hypothetical protein